MLATLLRLPIKPYRVRILESLVGFDVGMVFFVRTNCSRLLEEWTGAQWIRLVLVGGHGSTTLFTCNCVLVVYLLVLAGAVLVLAGPNCWCCWCCWSRLQVLVLAYYYRPQRLYICNNVAMSSLHLMPLVAMPTCQTICVDCQLVVPVILCTFFFFFANIQSLPSDNRTTVAVASPYY